MGYLLESNIQKNVLGIEFVTLQSNKFIEI